MRVTGKQRGRTLHQGEFHTIEPGVEYDLPDELGHDLARRGFVDVNDAEESDDSPVDEPDADESGGDSGEVVEPVSRPAQGDPKADWVDYRVSQGYDRDEAEALIKADLIDLGE